MGGASVNPQLAEQIKKHDEANLQKNLQKGPTKGEYLRTGRIPYPKHVWSPSGGWYAQPGNWKLNTAIAGAALLGVSLFVVSVSAKLEHRFKFPEEGRFYPSRYISKQVIEHEREQKAAKGQ